MFWCCSLFWLRLLDGWRVVWGRVSGHWTHLKETKEQFFGKQAGTECLGFMLMSNAELKEGVVDVHFYVFFSDDTTHDNNFVLAAKHYIYNNIAPSLFPEGTQVKVKFESDDAGCFNSHLAKATMPFWDEWTGGRVVEIQIRHSVNGVGKSPLDGFLERWAEMFLMQLTMALQTSMMLAPVSKLSELKDHQL
jgi:hypothetical protein